MRKSFFNIGFCLIAGLAAAQNKYGLTPVGLEGLRASIKNHPEKELIDLEKSVPGVVLDIRYATENNFTGKKIYDYAAAYARKPVSDALIKAQLDFKKLGWGIKIFDAYRPYRATVLFYEIYHDTTYVASPYRGSRHNRGCAIDMTVIDLTSRREIKMPTGYDSFSKDAWPTTPAKDLEAGKNRAQLISVMERHGFKVNASEWWHFDFVGWQKFEVLDVEFKELRMEN